jgi:hypothetical protein
MRVDRICAPPIGVALLVAACTPAMPPPLRPSAASQSRIECHLAERPDGQLSIDGAQGQLSLTCDAKNLTNTEVEACATPYLGVLATGSVYATHAPVCFELGPDDTSRQIVGTQVPRGACLDDSDGCALRTFMLDPTLPPVSDALAFAEQMEDHARRKGTLQPTVRECLDLVQVWQHRPEFSRARGALTSASEAVLVCRLMARVDYECLRAARDDRDIEACAPHR